MDEINFFSRTVLILRTQNFKILINTIHNLYINLSPSPTALVINRVEH